MCLCVCLLVRLRERESVGVCTVLYLHAWWISRLVDYLLGWTKTEGTDRRGQDLRRKNTLCETVTCMHASVGFQCTCTLRHFQNHIFGVLKLVLIL